MGSLKWKCHVNFTYSITTDSLKWLHHTTCPTSQPLTKYLRGPDSAVAAQVSKLLSQFLSRSSPPVPILPQCTEPAFNHWCCGERDGGNFQSLMLSCNKHIPEKFTLNPRFVCEIPFSHCLLGNSRYSRDGQLKTDRTHLFSSTANHCSQLRGTRGKNHVCMLTKCPQEGFKPS